MLRLLNWFGNFLLLSAFLVVLGGVVTDSGPTLPPAQVQPLDPQVKVPAHPPHGVPGASVLAWTPPRPRRRVSVRSGSRSYSGSRSISGGGFRFGK